MDELVIEVERRGSTGKGANRKLRREGLIPAVVYGGKDKESVAVALDRHTVTELLRQEKGRNTVFLLKMKGTKQERHAMVRDAQIDPLTRQYAHLDFIRVIKGQRLKVEIPIVVEGEAAGVKVGGFLDWVGRTVHIECAAEAIPESFRVDVTNLELGHHIAAADLPLPEGVRLLDDPRKMIVTVKTHAKEVEEAKPAEAAAAGEEATEPEVIKRGKAVEEGSGDAE
ncbi:MAG: 50S ribosomal protein L25 [Thermoanaerobaculaceae bacterium]|nr:50S ribosomal protein L25 [Thermoanaerobaculaceae bacterium]TAM47125.1 MAG: 50S ribosomal protein L25 [Acidobacteriota bacterium]